MIDIHRMTIEEVWDGILLGQQMHNESEFAFLDYDKTKLMNFARCAINDPNYCFLSAVDDGELVGMMIGYISEYFFGKDLIASDLLLFVKQERRGLAAAKKLLDTFRDWGVSKGAKEICLGVSTGIKYERTAKCYEHWGYPQIGTIHKMRIV